MIHKAYRYRIYPNKAQQAMMTKTFGCVRFVYIICMEDLNIQEMMKDHRLARLIADAGWGSFIRMVEYKATWRGKTTVRTGRFFASSQLCSQCGNQNLDVKDLSVRAWTCPVCGAVHHRDRNAAMNTLMEGLRILETVSV